MYFSNMIARTTGGTIAMTPAAFTKEKLVVKSITKPAITIGKVCASMFWVRIRAKRNSFVNGGPTPGQRGGVKAGQWG